MIWKIFCDLRDFDDSGYLGDLDYLGWFYAIWVILVSRVTWMIWVNWRVWGN